METRDRELLEKTFDYVRENNRILKDMRRSARLAGLWRAIYWLMIIVAAVWLYYYLRPFLEPLLETYGRLGQLKDLNETLKSGILP